MGIKTKVWLKVNEVEISKVSLRHPVIDGHIDSTKYEVTIVDPLLGNFALTNDCLIEIKVSNENWRKVSSEELATILLPKNS